MDIPDALRRHLDSLTEALDIPGADLQAMLEVLIDDLTSAVPSFLGLRITLTAGEVSTTMSSADRQSIATARASLLLPLRPITGLSTDDTMVLFAAQPGAFNHLAMVTRDAFDLDGRVLIDQHLPATRVLPDPHPIGTENATMINMAIGVLIEQGNLPDEAHGELARRAVQHKGQLAAAAREILHSLTPGPDPGDESL